MCFFRYKNRMFLSSEFFCGSDAKKNNSSGSFSRNQTTTRRGQLIPRLKIVVCLFSLMKYESISTQQEHKQRPICRAERSSHYFVGTGKPVSFNKYISSLPACCGRSVGGSVCSAERSQTRLQVLPAGSRWGKTDNVARKDSLARSTEKKRLLSLSSGRCSFGFRRSIPAVGCTRWHA